MVMMGYLRKINSLNPLYFVSNYKYRVYAEHVEAIRGCFWFVVNNGYIGMSVDGGKSIKNNHKIAFAEYDKIEFSHIFKNGSLIFATQNKIYKSTDLCATITEIAVKDLNGLDYTPVNDAHNYLAIGRYLTQNINGKETILWGNYTNLGIDTNVNIYTVNEDITTVNIIYTFGYNSTYPGAPGNIDNDTICRHIHSINYDQYTNQYWVWTGDHEPDGKYENHWITLKYVQGTWIATIVKSGDRISFYKVGGMYFDENYIYWNTDVDVRGHSKNGFWRVARTDIDNELLFERKGGLYYPSLPGFQKNNIIFFSYTYLNGISNTVELSKNNGIDLERLTITDGLGGDSTFLRPDITYNDIIRMDAKLITSGLTLYVPTILFYL